MSQSKSYVLIQYFGEKDERARLESGGEKVVFESGDVQFAEVSRAKHLCGTYQFQQVDPINISVDMLKDAKKRLENKKVAAEERAKEQEEISKREDAMRDKLKERVAELRANKDKYNRREIDNEEYQEEKEKIMAKWDKILNPKAKKGKKAKEEPKEEKVEEDEKKEK